MNNEQAIIVIRDFLEDPDWVITAESVRELENNLFFNEIHAQYVMQLEEALPDDTPWNTVYERTFWLVRASNEDRVKAAATVVLAIKGSSSLKSIASNIE